MDLNKVMIIGRLTRDPELRTIPSGTSVCTISVATSYVYNNQQTGQKVEQVEYHNVVLWRKLGEIAAQYLKKGTQVFIEGRLQTRSWEDKNGGPKHYRTEIVADNMIMLGKSNGQGAGQPYSAPARNNTSSPAQETVQSSPSEELPTIQQGEDINVEDIPF
jgi:single-strand DNA-binding protein